MNGRPLLGSDALGLLSIDPSCTACPVNGSRWDQEMLSAFDFACANVTSGVSDPALRECISKKCSDPDFKVICSRQCEPGQGGYAQGNILLGSTLFPVIIEWNNSVTICPASFFSPREAGPVLIHEIAHTCGWRHFGAQGVPDPNCAGLPLCTGPYYNVFYPRNWE